MSPAGSTPVIENRKARHEFHVLETFEAGIVLSGTEVKSLRAGKANIGDAFVVFHKDEAYLQNCRIDEFMQGNRWNHDPDRRRKLLLHRLEIEKMEIAVARKGMAAVPLRLYFKGSYAKILIGLCKGKDVADKRQTKIERDAKREIERSMKKLLR